MPEDQVTQATIRLAGESDAYSLSEWLNRAGHFRGLVDVTSLPPEQGETPAIADMVTVDIASGGMLALLISKIYDWIAMRPHTGSLQVTYTRPGGTSAEIKVDRAQDRALLIDRVRRCAES
jgi:hypothetical protein